MSIDSLAILPSVPVCPILSDPAKSTNSNLEDVKFSPVILSIDSTRIVRIV